MTFLTYIGSLLVVSLVPGSRTGRRRVRGTANLLRQGREETPLGHAVVQHCSLCSAALVVDSYALAVVVLYPGLSQPGADAESGFVRVWVDYLPGALRGLDAGGLCRRPICLRWPPSSTGHRPTW